jgi:hypothetical protein
MLLFEFIEVPFDQGTICSVHSVTILHAILTSPRRVFLPIWGNKLDRREDHFTFNRVNLTTTVTTQIKYVYSHLDPPFLKFCKKAIKKSTKGCNTE